MAEAYSVAAELTLKTNIPAVMRDMIDALERGRRAVVDLQAEFDALGRAGKGISAMVRQLAGLQDIRFPTGLTAGAEGFESKLSGAVDRMSDLVRGAREVAAALAGARMPPGGGGRLGGGRGGGGHGGGDPLMEGIFGGELLGFYADNYQDYAKVETTYRGFQSDSRLGGNSPAYKAMRAQAADQLARYRSLSPLDVARNAGEAFAVGGGDMREQSAIADMLDRAEQNLIARNPNLDAADAQRQAVAMLKGLDIANRFFDQKTGQFSTDRANTELDRVQALLAASNGLATGQNFLAFEKSAKLAGQRLSLEGEAELAHYIEINPSRAGTALNSFENLFGGHASRMVAADKAFFTKQGLYGQDGRLVDSDLLGSNPLEWISKHLAHINIDDISDRTQRQNVGSLIAETLGAQGNINRQASSTARQNVTGNAANLLDSPGGKLLVFDASLERFRVSLGAFESGPGAQILDGLSAGLDKLTAVMKEHPTAAKAFLELTAGIAAFAVVRGAFVLSGLGTALKGFSVAIEAVEAVAVVSPLGPLGAGLLAVAAGITAIAAAVHYFPGMSVKLPNARNPASPPSAHDFAFPFAPTQPQKQSYETGVGAPPVQHINLIVDGKKMAEIVTTHQVRAMRPNVQTGTSGPDWLQTPLPVGMSPMSI